MTLSKALTAILVISLAFLYACQTQQQLTIEPEPTEAKPTDIYIYPEVDAGLFDNGKMWTFEHPPLDYFSEEYGLDVDENWMTHARLGTIRLPNCTASFVSPNGLLLTNHHCTRDEVTTVTREGENLTDDGFYAINLSDERQIEDYYVDQLIDMVDVTDVVYNAIDGIDDLQERLEVIDSVISGLQQEIADTYDEPVVVEIIALYNGAMYTAYVFRRFEDIRLVMVPELEVGYFGGDPDNFTYPRYTLDMTFLRVYENNQPYQPEYWFNWSTAGVTENEPVFVVGNPGSTSRLKTLVQLEYIRDAEHPAFLQTLIEVNDAFLAYESVNPEQARLMDLRNLIFLLQNAIKAYSGGLETLEDDFFMGRRQSAEIRFLDDLAERPELMDEFGSLYDELLELAYQKREVMHHYIAMFGINPGTILSSGIMQRAMMYGRANAARAEGDNQRADYYDMLVGYTVEWPEELEHHLTATRIMRLLDYLHDDYYRQLRELMNGMDAHEYAGFLLSESALNSTESAMNLVQSDLPDRDDPAVRLGMLLGPEFERVMGRINELEEREQDLERQLGRARYEVYGTAIPPDATFSLRLQDGRVLGYDYNGTRAPVNTTFYGMFNRHFSHGGIEPWGIPDRWFAAADGALDLSTPLNFVSTNDIIGGNSGSPILNSRLEVVGLIFDGNIESLSGDFIYTDETARAISVDARGMLEALRIVYSATRLVDELLEYQSR